MPASGGRPTLSQISCPGLMYIIKKNTQKNTEPLRCLADAFTTEPPVRTLLSCLPTQVPYPPGLSSYGLHAQTFPFSISYLYIFSTPHLSPPDNAFTFILPQVCGEPGAPSPSLGGSQPRLPQRPGSRTALSCISRWGERLRLLSFCLHSHVPRPPSTMVLFLVFHGKRPSSLSPIHPLSEGHFSLSFFSGNCLSRLVL